MLLGFFEATPARSLAQQDALPPAIKYHKKSLFFLPFSTRLWYNKATMDPKQTAPQGGQPGGQEGQNGQAQSTGANPVFGAAGNLGGNTLSTGANVSQTMDSLNSGNSFTSGKSLLQRKRVDNVDPVTGDIIISSSPNDKPAGGSKPINKALLIKIGGVILVLGAIALVVGIVMAFVSGGDKKSGNGGGSGSSNNIPQTGAVDQSFARYANWIMNGTDKLKYSATDMAYYDTAAYKSIYVDRSDVDSFFVTAKEYYAAFVNDYNNNSSYNSSPILAAYVPSYQNTLDFVSNYAIAGDLSIKTLLGVYSESGGESGLKSYFEENYGVFRDSDYDVAREYYSLQESIFKYQYKVIDSAKKNKCIVDGEIKSDCKLSVDKDESNKNGEDSSKVNTIVRSEIYSLINSCNTIADEIASPAKAEETENEDGNEQKD